jgi:DNA topoisomerase-2
MSKLSKKYPWNNFENSVRVKDWAAGSNNQIESYELLAAGPQRKFTCRQVKYSPALLKIIDEIVVNALDHVVRMSAAPVVDHVKVVKIGYDSTSGMVSVENDGESLEIEIHPDSEKEVGKPVYIPTAVFGYAWQGSNLKKKPKCIIGGTNGLGSKITNQRSVRFIVECCDGINIFYQEWANGVEAGPPKITPAGRTKPYTRVSFVPDYALCNTTPDESFADLVQSRAVYAALYANFAGRAATTYNGAPITRSFKDFCEEVGASHCRVTPKHDIYDFPWEIGVSVRGQSGPAADIGKFSILNGIVVTEGKHLDMLLSQITEAARAAMAKKYKDKSTKFTTAKVAGLINLYVCCQIPNPSWDAQSKNKMVGPNPSDLAHYKLPAEFLARIVGKIMEALNGKLIDAELRKKIKYEKYTAADKLGRGSTLILVEGDSAKNQISQALKTTGNNTCGIISTGGVPMNVRKNRGGYKVSPKILKNEFIKALIAIIGLDINNTYEKEPLPRTGDFPFNYGQIVACVDQDLDGKGNILGLITNMFMLYWPGLIRDGFLKWFQTPLIWAYPKSGRVLAFYAQLDYDEFADKDSYEPKYCKGLASHSAEESIEMMRLFHENLVTFLRPETALVGGGSRDSSDALYEVYYGDDASKRKVALRLPQSQYTREILAEISAGKFNLKNYLELEVMPYMRDNLDRKLDSYIDGQNQAGRKVLDGILRKCGSRPWKVSDLAGKISELTHYHHGVASMEKTIIGKAQVYWSGLQLPFLLPRSYMGSRLEGSKDSGASRYVSVVLNARLTSVLFPGEDYHTLEFNHDENERVEPKYFLPIVPLAVLEHKKIPSHGWSLNAWARDIYDVIDIVERLIKLGDRIPFQSPRPHTYAGTPYSHLGQTVNHANTWYSVGSYTHKPSSRGDTITITELPLRTWTKSYREKQIAAVGKGVIASVGEDRGAGGRVKIEIKLEPDVDLDEYATDQFDGPTELLSLRTALKHNLNMMGPRDEALEFKDYDEVILAWFPHRKAGYIERITRKKILLKLRIFHLTEKIRWLKGPIDMTGKTIEEMKALIVAAGYAKIAHGLLRSPKFIRTAKLEHAILHGPKANHDYILEVKEYEKARAHIADQEELLAELKDELAIEHPGRFPGAAEWLEELAELREVVTAGFKCGWNFTAKKYSY